MDISRPGNAISCGFIVSASLLIAGVSGPILDIYYVKTSLSRFQIHATKGVTQGIGHVVKVAYFIVILGLVEDGLGPLPIWIFIIVIPVAYLGSIASRRVLKAMEDQQFKKYTQTATMAVGAIFLTKGIHLLLSGPV